MEWLLLVGGAWSVCAVLALLVTSALGRAAARADRELERDAARLLAERAERLSEAAAVATRPRPRRLGH